MNIKGKMNIEKEQFELNGGSTSHVSPCRYCLPSPPSASLISTIKEFQSYLTKFKEKK
jgi:hypothetical protein